MNVKSTTVIEIAGITKTYHMGHVEVPVLHGIDLSIGSGEFVAIMGPSGSGKSTLLHILGLLDRPDGGTFKLAGREVSRLADADLAKMRNATLGFVFQSFNLLARLSALDNVLLPQVYADGKAPHAETRRRAEELLRKVGLADRMHHKPNELSGGQQQRVAIARALMNNPSMILADEPTGNLDSKSAVEIIDILKDLNASGITIVMVTHEPNLARAASRVVRLADGLVSSDETLRPPVCADGHCAPSVRSRVAHHMVALNRMREYFGQAMRALWSNKTRSLLSILGVLIGVAGLIAMLALGKGAKEETRKQMASLGSNILMVRPGGGSSHGISMESGGTIQLSLDDVDAVRRNVANVSRVTPYVNGRGQAIFGSKNYNTRVEGSAVDYVDIKNAKPAQGRFFTAEEVTAREKVAVLGKTVVDELFGGKNPVGEFIKINRIDFLVIGVLPTKGSSGWRNEDDKIEVPVNTAMYRLFGREYIDYMDVQISDEKYLDNAGYRIKQLITQMHRLDESKSDSVDVRNMAEMQATITATMGIFSTLLGSVAFISLLVGGIGIMNIMLVSVTERTREIGLRKALGATGNDVLFQFMIEAVVICGVGGVIGIAFGSGIAISLAVFAGWKTMVSASSIILAFTFSILVGLVFGTWPAKKASSLNPIEALRYE